MITSAASLRPNFSTTTSTTSTTATAAAAGAASAQATAPGGDMGKDAFMKLLVAQMQNQDPMNPMQGDQMAAQLAQFSSLEQLQQMNQTLADQGTAQGALLGAIQSNAAIASIGHTVLAVGNGVEIGGSSPTTSVTADLATNTATATLKIYDSAGTVVGSRDLGALSSGRHTFDLGDATKGLGDGNYTYSIEATDSAGAAVPVTTYMSGRVNGISSTPTGLVLNLGTLTVPYSSVIQVSN
jgi:flagellar basal-body rod modification protein FlgD